MSSKAIERYRQEIAQKRRQFHETNNKNAKRRISREVERVNDTYYRQLVPAAQVRWQNQIAKYQRVEASLQKAEADARYRLNKEADQYVNIARARVEAASGQELREIMDSASNDAEAYAIALAVRARVKEKTKDFSVVATRLDRNDYHEDKTYREAYERAVTVAEETKQVHAECSEVQDVFSDTSLNIQLGRWQSKQTYETGGGIVTEYSLLDDPTEYAEAITAALKTYGGGE